MLCLQSLLSHVHTCWIKEEGLPFLTSELLRSPWLPAPLQTLLPFADAASQHQQHLPVLTHP